MTQSLEGGELNGDQFGSLMNVLTGLEGKSDTMQASEILGWLKSVAPSTETKL
jgi:hypothetical protein